MDFILCDLIITAKGGVIIICTAFAHSKSPFQMHTQKEKRKEEEKPPRTCFVAQAGFKTQGHPPAAALQEQGL